MSSLPHLAQNARRRRLRSIFQITCVLPVMEIKLEIRRWHLIIEKFDVPVYPCWLCQGTSPHSSGFPSSAKARCWERNWLRREQYFHFWARSSEVRHVSKAFIWWISIARCLEKHRLTVVKDGVSTSTSIIMVSSWIAIELNRSIRLSICVKLSQATASYTGVRISTYLRVGDAFLWE